MSFIWTRCETRAQIDINTIEMVLPDALYKAHPGRWPGVSCPRTLLNLTIVRHQHTICLLAVCEHRAHRTSVAPFGLLYYMANLL